MAWRRRSTSGSPDPRGSQPCWKSPRTPFAGKAAACSASTPTASASASSAGCSRLFGGKRTQRIPTENLRAVYREGDALRVEFQDGETARIVLPFWADDRETAAKIVRLLPTSQTVEIEHSTDVTHSAKPRADWRMLLTMGVALVALVVGSWASVRPRAAAVAPALAPVSSSAGDRVAVRFSADARRNGVAGRIAGVASRSRAGRHGAQHRLSPMRRVRARTRRYRTSSSLRRSNCGAPGPLPMPHDYVRSEDFVIRIAPDTTAYYVAETRARGIRAAGQPARGSMGRAA